MINLLPHDEKKKLLHEYRLRLFIVLLCAFFALEMLGLLLFTPAYYTIYLSVRDLRQSLLEKRALAPKVDDEAQMSLAKVKKEIAQLKPSADIVDVPPSLLLEELILQKPSGIVLNALAYARTVDGVSIQFSGTALLQEDLLLFRRNVKMDPRVVDFKYGSSFITKKTNIDFSAAVTLK